MKIKDGFTEHGYACECKCHSPQTTHGKRTFKQTLNLVKRVQKKLENTQESGWEKEFRKKYTGFIRRTNISILDGNPDEAISFIRSLLLSEQKRWRTELEKRIEEMKESHTHNSIPSYTACLDEGCSICIKNKDLSDILSLKELGRIK